MSDEARLIEEPARRTPVAAEAEVLVVGADVTLAEPWDGDMPSEPGSGVLSGFRTTELCPSAMKTSCGPPPGPGESRFPAQEGAGFRGVV